MKEFTKSIILIIAICLSSSLFAQNHKPYPEFQKFHYASYDNLDKTEKDFKPLFNNAVKEAESITDSFTKNLRLAWCYYIMSNIFYALENPTKTEQYCDKAVEYAKLARNEKENEESLLIYVNAIGQNCQVKPLPWLMKNGIDVNPLAKKIIKLNPKNARALFLRDSQDVYAPSPFNNFKKGAENMKILLADKSLQMIPQDLFDILCAESYALINLDKKNEARSYLEQARLLFPENINLKKLDRMVN